MAETAIASANTVSTCRDAIAAYWPAETRELALFMLTQENGKELPGRVSAANADPWHSHDHGCLQVNDHWHFGTKGWTNFDDIYDPSFNVQYALKIFKGRGNWGGWYSVCTVDHQPKFPGYWCK